MDLEKYAKDAGFYEEEGKLLIHSHNYSDVRNWFLKMKRNPYGDFFFFGVYLKWIQCLEITFTKILMLITF